MSKCFEEMVNAIPLVRSSDPFRGNRAFFEISSYAPLSTVEQIERAQFIVSLYPKDFRLLRHEAWFDGNPALCCLSGAPHWAKETDQFVQYGESVVLGPSPEVLGYTHSGGFCLCRKHGTKIWWDQENGKYVRGEIEDVGNETGHVLAILSGTETDSDLICEVCYKDGDVRNAIILEKNIDLEEEETCIVCGLPAEGEEVCECECGFCGTPIFNEQSLLDHGMCSDCHKRWQMGELTIGD